MGSKKTKMAKNTKPVPMRQALALTTSVGDKTLIDEITSKPATVPTGLIRVASKLSRLEGLLSRPKGATVAQLAEALGWQKHSVRGAMSGTLKKRGLSIVSEERKGERFYRIAS